MIRSVWLVGIGLLCLSAAVSAAERVTLKNFVVGTTVHGPKLDKEAMRGKVVLVEFWGPT